MRIMLLLAIFAFHNTYAQEFSEICNDEFTNGFVVEFEEYNGSIYATGFFNVLCDQSINYVAKWENDQWVAAEFDLTDPGHSFRVIDEDLYIARYEESIDSNWVYVYDGVSLEKLGKGVYLTTASGLSNLPNIYDVIEYNGTIVACGEFDRVGEEEISGIMQWDGTDWSPMGAGLTGNIQGSFPLLFPHSLYVQGNDLYVTGNFRFAGEVEANGIAKWNGTEWEAVGAGFNGTVYSLINYNGELIAGGSFTESNGVEMNRIAKWNGTDWEPFDFGFTDVSPFFIFVHTLKELNGELLIAGGLKEIAFENGETQICNGIISYSNGEINTFSGGVPDKDIEAVALTDDNRLLIGGGVFGNGYTGISNSPLGTEQIEDDLSLRVFPNPFSDSFDVASDKNYTSYIIQDYSGRIVSEGNFTSRMKVDLPAGVYLLKLLTFEGRSVYHRIVRTTL